MDPKSFEKLAGEIARIGRELDLTRAMTFELSAEIAAHRSAIQDLADGLGIDKSAFMADLTLKKESYLQLMLEVTETVDPGLSARLDLRNIDE